MSKASSTASLLAALVLSATTFCPLRTMADEPEKADNGVQKYPWHYINDKELPDVFPLVSVDAEASLQLKLFDLETRQLKVSLKNVSKKPVTIKTIKRGCPCLALTSPIDNAVIEPGALLPVEFTINAKKLTPGKFDRFFFVDVDGYEYPARLPVRGEITEPFKFTPNKVIQLGDFIGDVPWTRTFTIESTLEPDKVAIKPPENHQFLNIEVKKESPTVFKVVVSPKGKLAPRKLKEEIQLPVEGIPDYGPIIVGIKGLATGWALAVENNSFVFPKNKINHEETIVVEAKLILRSEKNEKASKPQRRGHTMENPFIAVESVADNEEKAAHPLSSPETWKPLLKEIYIDYLPDTVKLDKIPSDGGIVLKFTLPPGFFKSSVPYLHLPVKYKGDILAIIKVVSR